MLPHKDLRDLALYDPVAAYGILAGFQQAPIYLNARASFSDFTINGVPVPATIDTTIASRIWIKDIKYSVRQPNVFAGNIQKTQYDAALRQATGVDVSITVYSGPRYVPAINPTPLENLGATFFDLFPTGWQIWKEQSIKVDFVLAQAPPSISPNGPPYEVAVTFRGWQFLDTRLDGMSPACAPWGLLSPCFLPNGL